MPKTAAGSLGLLLALAAAAPCPQALGAETGDVPPNLVVDLRLYEARSSRPDFQAMEGLAFFVDTDGTGVSEQQWLATIARQAPDAVLATLATETLPVKDAVARFRLDKRSRSFEVTLDVKGFLERGTFEGEAAVRLLQNGEPVREFVRDIELRAGQTYVWAGRNLELSGTEYLSHFRDFEDAEHRGEIYESVRDFTIHLILAATPRLPDGATAMAAPVAVSLPEGVELPRLESPLGVPLMGEVVLDLDLDGEGAPADVRIFRSSLPEVHPRLLGEVLLWKFPQAAGQRARLELELRAEP